MDARSLAKSLHPLEVKVLLRYPAGEELDAARLGRELSYKEGQANQAFSWLAAKSLAAESGRVSRVFFELTPLGRALAAEGTPEERILSRLASKGPATLPALCAELGLGQKEF